MVTADALVHLDRPRERLLAAGARALSDARLVALALGTGSAGLSARAGALGLVERALLTRLSPFLALANAVLGESERFPVELRSRAARPQLGGASAAPPRPPIAASEKRGNVSLSEHAWALLESS